MMRSLRREYRFDYKKARPNRFAVAGKEALMAKVPAAHFGRRPRRRLTPEEGLIDITVVLDRSGSMESCRDATIEGFNKFLEDQRKEEGRGRVSLFQFDNLVYEPVFEGKDLQEAPGLSRETFVPRGDTSLFDAIGRTINATAARVEALPEGERPTQILFVVITDGHENASKEFTRPMVFSMIEEHKVQYEWQFVFIGADQDAIEAGRAMAVSRGASRGYAATPVGTAEVFGALSRSVSSYRVGGEAVRADFFSPPTTGTNAPNPDPKWKSDTGAANS